MLENGGLIFSNPNLEELVVRLQWPKLDCYVCREHRIELLADLEAVAEWTAISGALHACCDPDDDKFLETALSAPHSKK